MNKKQKCDCITLLNGDKGHNTECKYFDSKVFRPKRDTKNIKSNQSDEEIMALALDLTEMLMRMFTSKRRKETFYVNKIAEKLNKIIEKKNKSCSCKPCGCNEMGEIYCQEHML